MEISPDVRLSKRREEVWEGWTSSLFPSGIDKNGDIIVRVTRALLQGGQKEIHNVMTDARMPIMD